MKTFWQSVLYFFRIFREPSFWGWFMGVVAVPLLFPCCIVFLISLVTGLAQNQPEVVLALGEMVGQFCLAGGLFAFYASDLVIGTYEGEFARASSWIAGVVSRKSSRGVRTVSMPIPWVVHVASIAVLVVVVLLFYCSYEAQHGNNGVLWGFPWTEHENLGTVHLFVTALAIFIALIRWFQRWKNIEASRYFSID